MSGEGLVYLLHFSRRISQRHTCRHYLGWCKNLAERIQSHKLGHGARLTAVAHERGITFTVARVWRGDRALERRLKRRKEGPRLCPICNRQVQRDGRELTADEIEEALIGF